MPDTTLHVNKAATCERVQTGVKHVEEHDEPSGDCPCRHRDGCTSAPTAAGTDLETANPEPGGATSAWEHHYG